VEVDSDLSFEGSDEESRDGWHGDNNEWEVWESNGGQWQGGQEQSNSGQWQGWQDNNGQWHGEGAYMHEQQLGPQALYQQPYNQQHYVQQAPHRFMQMHSHEHQQHVLSQHQQIHSQQLQIRSPQHQKHSHQQAPYHQEQLQMSNSQMVHAAPGFHRSPIRIQQ
jgi:hypothetical protein